ncbi:glutathione S-transferase family protein [Silvimonas sp.]|uniref:glutathione S-transferase family protein n=1 Tax=Silvimonas sp. TaxID=2650811 RepID=UPI00283E461A|nr:glutathione S-transferase family protein [Silvimonas sp.]MDR3427450.1 glutathione S-transferase family protein [Silvimonas sp.]
MFILYGAQSSGAAAVEAALGMVNVPFRLVDAASWQPGPGLDELRQVNPLAQIPTLVLPDDSVLSESAAILIHLGLAYPDSGLLPTDASQRAQAIRGLVYITANCYAAIGVIDYPERWTETTDEQEHARVKQGARQRLHGLWDIFADTFPATPFLNGEQPGALDLLAVVVSKWSGTRAHLAQSRPAFSDLLKHIEQHPVFATVNARYWP